MTTFDELGTVDLRTLLTLIADAKDDDPGPGLPWALLDGLSELIPCTEVGFNHFDRRTRQFHLIQAVDSGVGFAITPDVDDDHPWWTEFPRLSRTLWDGPTPAVARWSERGAIEIVRRTTLYEEMWDPTSDCMILNLPGTPGDERRLVFWRTDGSVFSARDEALLTLLRPHLIEIDQDARRRRAGTPQLTPREWQILELVANGLSNAEVADALVTSVSTVRKHLEHIYERTATRNRSAAVAKMLPR